MNDGGLPTLAPALDLLIESDSGAGAGRQEALSLSTPHPVDEIIRIGCLYCERDVLISGLLDGGCCVPYVCIFLRYIHTPIPAPPITTAPMAAHRAIGEVGAVGGVEAERGVGIGVAISVGV